MAARSPGRPFMADAARGARRSSAPPSLTLALAIAATTSVFGVVDAVLLRALPYRTPSASSSLSRHSQKHSQRRSGSPRPITWPVGERASAFDPWPFRNRDTSCRAWTRRSESWRRGRRRRSFGRLGVDPRWDGPSPVKTMRGEAGRGDQRRALAPQVRRGSRRWSAAPSCSTVVPTRSSASCPAASLSRPGTAAERHSRRTLICRSVSPSRARRIRSMYNNCVVARLKPGVSVTQADAEVRCRARAAPELYPAELQGLARGRRRISDAVPRRNGRTRARCSSCCVWRGGLRAPDRLRRHRRPDAHAAVSRRREIAVRTRAWRRARADHPSVLVESGPRRRRGGRSACCSRGGSSRTLVAAAPPAPAGLAEIDRSRRVLLFSALFSLLTALLCGLIPALEISRPGSGPGR